MSEYDPDMTEPDATPDAFERGWMDTLAEPEQDLAASEDAFVQAVLSKHTAQDSPPAVAGRIGFRTRRFAAAAAIALAALAGWFVASNLNPAASGENEIVENSDKEPQPGDEPAVVPAEPEKVPLGKLIAQAQARVTGPATSLTATVRDAPESFSIQRIIELIDNPLPNLKELLAPEEPDNQQSRA